MSPNKKESDEQVIHEEAILLLETKINLKTTKRKKKKTMCF